MLPPDDYKLISFDVTSLFTNVRLDYTIDVIFYQIYDQRELETMMWKKRNEILFATFYQKCTFFL